MGQKVHPIGFRVGITRKHDSRWYAGKKDFGRYLVQDHLIRKTLKKDIGFAGIPTIEIERDEDEIEITIHAHRVGAVVGQRGAEVDRIREKLEKLIGVRINIKIVEVRKPELCAQLVAESIAGQLIKRVNTRRAMKRAVEASAAAGVYGIKILCSGRLGGAEIARSDGMRVGSIPCQKLVADVDYGFSEALTTMGQIGVKVWIYRGDRDASAAL